MDKEYFATYRRHNYVSNTSVRDSKKDKLLGELTVLMAYIAKQDGGKVIDAKMIPEINCYLEAGWSNAIIINQVALGKVLHTSKTTISKYLKLAVAKDYVYLVGQFTLSGSKYPSTVYIVNMDAVYESYTEVWNSKFRELGSTFYNNLHVDDDTISKKLALNAKCMTEPLWQDLKAKIDIENATIPDKFKIKFLDKDANGNYINSRYYSILCASMNPERHPNESNRIELLQERFNTKCDFEEIDVNSMMLRTSYNLLNDEYLPIDADVYYEIYKLMHIGTMPYERFRRIARDCIKREIMAIYMDPRSVYCKTNCKLDNLNKVRYEAIVREVEYAFDLSYEEFLVRLKFALYKFLSVYDFDYDYRVFFGAMYFKYEAIVYYYMNKKFKNLGIYAANVYDGFYFTKGTMNTKKFYAVYHEAISDAKALLNKYDHDLVSIYGKQFKEKMYYGKKN